MLKYSTWSFLQIGDLSAINLTACHEVSLDLLFYESADYLMYPDLADQLVTSCDLRNITVCPHGLRPE